MKRSSSATSFTSITSVPSRNVSPTKLFSVVKGRPGPHREKPGTAYCSTLINLIKGSLGTGIFAMGGAMKNGGLIAGPSLLIVIGFLNLYCQRQVVKAADQVAFVHNYNVKPDYAETVLVCFMDGPEKTRNLCFSMKKIVNILLVITQMGFCCVYLVFIGDSLEKILEFFDIHCFSVRILILFSIAPIWLMSLINSFKVLVPISMLANIFTAIGIVITLYYNFIDMPSPWELPLVADLRRIPLFFGTALFTFESVGLILPMYNEMENPNHFRGCCGILNIGMTYIIAMNTLVGVTSYIKWGVDIKPSVTLNMPKEILAVSVVILIAASVALSYILQMYVAYMILFSWYYRKFGPFKHQFWVEVLFKTILSTVAYILAESIPFLGEFISIVGGVGGTSLALIFPPLLEIIVFHETIGCLSIFKNIIILTIGSIGIVTNLYFSILEIIFRFQKDSNEVISE